MKSGILFLSILFLMIPELKVWSQEKAEVVVEEKMVVVKATEVWVNTWIPLFQQDKVYVKTSGKIRFSDGYTESTVDADGWGIDTYKNMWGGDANYCDDPLLHENHAALIGNVGDNTFFIGKEKRFTDKDGTLYLGINDCTFTGPFYNTGQFEVYIKVEHIKK